MSEKKSLPMKIVKKRADELGIQTKGRSNKKNLVQEIQVTEGNQPCFSTKKECNEVGCAWFYGCKRK